MSNFDNSNHYSPHLPYDGQGNRCDQTTPDALDNLKRDRFELLSAYLDGEVTADERRQVETWLKTDPTVQRLYMRLLKLRQGLQALPVPSSEYPVEQMAEQVMSRLARRPRRKLLWGGMAAAALFVSAIVGTLPRTDLTPSVVSSLPQGRQSDSIPSEGLMIALDHPVIEIPKAAVSEFGQPIEGAQ